VQVVEYDDSGHRPGNDVTSDVRALVGDVVEILAQFSAGLTVDLKHRYQLRRVASLAVVRPNTQQVNNYIITVESTRIVQTNDILGIIF